MGQLEDMAMFIRIVEAGSLTKAADQLHMAKSAVSRRLTDLEKRLGTQLLTRTTRRSHLTDAGTVYYNRAKTILDDVNTLNEDTSGEQSSIEGTLKITAPLSFGLLHLSPLLDQYATAHPDVQFHVDFTDRHVDLVEEGVEMAIRIGQLKDSSYQAKQITPMEHVLCASPSLFSSTNPPEHPAQLADHPFLFYGLLKEPQVTVFDKDNNTHNIHVNPKACSNNGDFLKDMAVRGHGITYLPKFMVYKELEEKTLIQLLPNYHLPTMHLYAVYPRNRFLPQRCRLFIDYLSEQFGESPCWN